MHCIATTVKEVKILTVSVPVGPLVTLHVFERVYQGEGVTLICTLVTTVSDQIVAVVNHQDMDYKWLVDGQSTPNLSVKT